MIEDSWRFRQSSSVVARQVGGEQILLPLTERAVELTSVYVLNEVAKYVWDRLDGKRNLAAVADDVADEFDVGPEKAREDVEVLLSELLEAQLVEKAD